MGCRLYYPDDRVQYDGIIIARGVAGYAHPNSKEDSGEFGRSKVIRNYSAVTAAALAIKKSIYDEVGGLDAITRLSLLMMSTFVCELKRQVMIMCIRHLRSYIIMSLFLEAYTAL